MTIPNNSGNCILKKRHKDGHIHHFVQQPQIIELDNENQYIIQ